MLKQKYLSSILMWGWMKNKALYHVTLSYKNSSFLLLHSYCGKFNPSWPNTSKVHIFHWKTYFFCFLWKSWFSSLASFSWNFSASWAFDSFRKVKSIEIERAHFLYRKSVSNHSKINLNSGKMQTVAILVSLSFFTLDVNSNIIRGTTLGPDFFRPEGELIDGEKIFS